MQFSRINTLLAAISFYILCFAFQSSGAVVTGVITHRGKPVNGFSVRIQPHHRKSDQTTTSGGYYKLTSVPLGDSKIYINPKPPASAPRYYPKMKITKSEEIRCYEMIPYYAADHGAFDYDLRLHRSWGNALDNPFDTASFNALFENTHTFSGIVLKPVYLVAAAAEVVWTVPGFVIGMGVASAPKVVGDDFNMFGLSRTLLAGYLPIETVAKLIEVPVKTILWPIDRLVSKQTRKKLEDTRNRILKENGNPEYRNHSITDPARAE